MYAVCVTFQIKAGMSEEFMPLMQKQAQNSLALEEACHRFDVCTDADKPSPNSKSAPSIAKMIIVAGRSPNASAS